MKEKLVKICKAYSSFGKNGGRDMAMIECPECGQMVSDKAKSCPNCGMKLKKNYIVPIAIVIIVVLVMVIIVLQIRNGARNTVSNTLENSITNQIAANENATDKEMTEEDLSAIGFDEDTVDAQTIRKDQIVTVKDRCEFNIKGYTINNVIEPPKADGYYTYFEADSGSTFVDIKMSIKNLNNTAVMQDSVLDYVRLIYDDQYEYFCTFVTEEDNGKNLNSYTSIYSINPLSKMTYHMLAMVPSEVKSSSKSLEVIISADGTDYKCTLR